MAKHSFREKDLTKGELRKLTALRKSLGSEIANEAFSKWYEQQTIDEADPNIAIIKNALSPLLNQMRFPRGSGYAVRRGRGRFIIEPLG